MTGKCKTTPDADFSFVRYANCWEDADILVRALQPAPGKRFLSIASAGDNSLALLYGGASVVACDLNPAQIACAELRKAAIRELDHGRFLSFCGVHASADRLTLYESLRSHLPLESCQFWDERREHINSGFIHFGKFERYFALFRERVLPLIHRCSMVYSLLERRGVEDRRSFYSSKWNNLRWRIMFKIFFSRALMGRLGRDPVFFQHVEGSVASRILERTKYAFTELDPSQNPYLLYILTGNYGAALPFYLRAENYTLIRENIENLEIVCAPADAAASKYGSDSFDGYNLSDIFEYLSEDQTLTLYSSLLQCARPHARFAYWNMLVPRSCPQSLHPDIIALEDEAGNLFKEDQAFFYSRFVLEMVR
ncbi:MAG: DUF3419 family protein [Kiritimatiellae bacterium]|nr:DUF3419 family protein [Kiritimatiellia bacterium]